MPRSMTGYGRGESIQIARKIKVEIKAVNHRFSDFVIKIPRFLNPFEDRIRKLLAENIARGKVDVWIQFESFAQNDASVNINTNLADSFIQALSGLSNRYEFGRLQGDIAMGFLARHPDIITLDKFGSTLDSEEEQEEIWEALGAAVTEAITSFNNMRTVEGQSMADDIENNRALAQDVVAEIARIAPAALKAQVARLRERLEESIAKLDRKIDDVRLVTEMAIITDKGCISEELARLKSHFGQISTILQEEEAVGRKLDFLVQELNREANTIGSKSGDVGITKLVVELKSLIEKMREQAQNIE